jgi:hypothetical protein
MRLSFIAPLLLVGIAAWAQDTMPRMSTVEPGSGKKGDVVAVTGENLDKANVSKIYLTDGKNDLECVITGQSATEVKFKIPDKATGRMALMILTSGKEPKLIEQPVKVSIE